MVVSTLKLLRLLWLLGLQNVTRNQKLVLKKYQKEVNDILVNSVVSEFPALRRL